MSHQRRLLTVLAALSLLMTSLFLAPASSVDAQPLVVDEGFSLEFGLNPDRSDQVPLDGATVPADQDLAVSLVTPDLAINLVAFFVDDELVNVEFGAPFDLNGTAGNGDAAPSSFAAGPHNVTAFYIANGAIGAVTADFDAAAEAPPSILQIAQDAGLTNLINAVVAASGGDIDFAAAVADCNQDLTVFAPTNAAFDAIAEVAAGLTTEQLQTVIAYHVLAGAQTGADLLAAGTTTTLAGQDITITTNPNGDVIIEGIASTALVATPNLQACNGIVHVIDTVLLPDLAPPPAPSILQIAQDAGLTNLINAVVAASGGDIDFAAAVADCNQDLTVFAPTNAAFDAIAEVAAGLTTEQLQTVIAYHVLAGAQTGADLLAASTTTTLAGQDITITTNPNGDVIIEGIASTALVATPNLQACNGIVHVIDTVLLPELAPEPGDVIAPGNTVLLRNVLRDRFLDADPNGNVDLGSTVELDNQWILEPVGDGTWRLVNADFGHYLDADSPQKGFDVNLNPDPNGYGVEWDIVEQPDGNYTLRAVDLNRFLDSDRNGNVDTSFQVRADDIWEITLVAPAPAA